MERAQVLNKHRCLWKSHGKTLRKTLTKALKIKNYEETQTNLFCSLQVAIKLKLDRMSEWKRKLKAEGKSDPFMERQETRWRAEAFLQWLTNTAQLSFFFKSEGVLRPFFCSLFSERLLVMFSLYTSAVFEHQWPSSWRYWYAREGSRQTGNLSEQALSKSSTEHQSCVSFISEEGNHICSWGGSPCAYFKVLTSILWDFWVYWLMLFSLEKRLL